MKAKIIYWLEHAATLSLLVFIVAAFAFLCWVVVTQWTEHTERLEKRRAWLEKECRHTGFYGRSGEYRTYDCGVLGVVREEG